MLVHAAGPLLRHRYSGVLSESLYISLLQAIADTEGEITRRQVQISTAGKQAEKLSKECSRTQKELDKASADLQAKQREQEVSCRSCQRKEGLGADGCCICQIMSVNAPSGKISVSQYCILSCWYLI